ncbi:MAG: cation-translocating P-type ATPase [Bacillota bacterium]|nr:cation-translocating P-type ATPase [Bacillota bacterium]
MKYYLQDTDTVISHFNSAQNGLTQAEAERRLLQHGKNKLREAKRPSLLKRFIAQLINPMIIVLIAAAAISALTSFYAGESFADVYIILFVVILNAVLGVVQESKAEKAIEALREMTASTSKVLRNGELTMIKSELLVVGDVVVLEAGDAVPADLRILESASLQSEEAALTGESVAAEKTADVLNGADSGDIPLGDRRNMLYMGSSIVYGRGRAMVTATGMDTEMGKIATAIAAAEDGQTPLQQKLSQLSRVLTILVLAICALIFAFRLLQFGALSSEVVIDTFMLAVSLAVAAIPEGLAAVVTIVLSIGVTKMSKKNAVIRRLTAVETLGCTQVICSDKTGTLTQNKMTVVEYSADDQLLLARAMALCNDAIADEQGEIIGEPTEAALLAYAQTLGLHQSELKAELPRIGEAPFDSHRKMMSTVHQGGQGIVQYSKGAPDQLLNVCKYYLHQGRVIELTEQARQHIVAVNKQYADKALRVLACAYRNHETPPASYNAAALEQDMVFIGLTGMIDPVRPEVLDAIQLCKNAGIRPVMITGDHRDTAAAIAMELGIITDPAQAITGEQLDAISDEELAATIGNYSVFARVQPEHKVRIVSAWQANGAITAMTGDGVNDAPAIKNADIGVGMGITGTDVTKNVADMVLGDDNFATIVAAVEEGRRIYDNIRKTIQFLLGSNLSEVVAIFTATVLGFTILQPAHILWINLITDCFPALALGMEKGEADLMRRRPRGAEEGIFAGGVGAGVLYQGVLVAILTLAAYFIGHYIESGVFEITNSADGMTMAFLTLSMTEVFHSLNLRSLSGSIFTLKHGNFWLYGSMVLSLALTTIVIYVPALANAFGFEHISLNEYLIAMALAVSIIPIVEIIKLFQRSFRKRAK